MHTVDRTRTVVTHDAGHPRDQIVPFYETLVPRGYLGWGKSTQLGTGLGLAMGARLARPDWLSVNIMGDAAFGMVGMDFETALRAGGPDVPEGAAHRCLRRLWVVRGDAVADPAVHLHHQAPLRPAAGEVAPSHLDQHLADRVVQHQEQLVVGGAGDRPVELDVDLDA